MVMTLDETTNYLLKPVLLHNIRKLNDDLLIISIYKENEPGPRPIEEKIIYREQMETNLAKLTQQERKVYLLLQYETSKKEIAKHMAISQPRVTQFIIQIRKKLLPRS